MLNLRRHPATVEFGELECCALRKINADEAHQKFIRSFIAKAQESEPQHNWSILSESFTNTIKLVFIPNITHREFYLKLALAERKLLAQNQTAQLNCGHSAAEHVEALNMICSKMITSPWDN